jgi:hypothetical protein
MDGTSSTHGGDMLIKFWMKSMKERDRSEDLGVDGRITLKWILGK